MSKARLVITSVVLEGRSQTEVAAAYGVSKGWVSKLVARYREEGEAAFEPRSRRPKTSPNATPPDVVKLIARLRTELTAAGLDAGPDTIGWHLTQHHQIQVSAATISRHLTQAGLVTADPSKRPHSSYLRFEAELPNETWQSDFTHYRLATGAAVEILSWLDDHSRKALHLSAHHRVTGQIVLHAFCETCDRYGIPASTLTDNGMVFTTRLAGGRGGLNALEKELQARHVRQKNSTPNHPTTCGKVERFQQTLKKWLRAQPLQPSTVTELQALLEQFRDLYNTRRPHRSLPHRATPDTVYTARPKATPTPEQTRTHERVRHDRIDDSGVVTVRHAGRLHHIGIGRTHSRTHVILLIQDLHIRVVHAATGELLRELTLDPSKDYQPQPKKKP
jgi:transposase InsO family protein